LAKRLLAARRVAALLADRISIAEKFSQDVTILIKKAARVIMLGKKRLSTQLSFIWPAIALVL